MNIPERIDFLEESWDSIAQQGEVIPVPGSHIEELNSRLVSILLRQFPFSCYYLIAGDMVIVYGLFHCARNPAFMTKLLDSRDSVSVMSPKP